MSYETTRSTRVAKTRRVKDIPRVFWPYIIEGLAHIAHLTADGNTHAQSADANENS